MSKSTNQTASSSYHNKEVPTLVPPEKRIISKEDSILLELRSNPAEAASMKYKLNQCILKGMEEIHILMQCRADGKRLMAGLGLTDANAQRNRWKSMMMQ